MSHNEELEDDSSSALLCFALGTVIGLTLGVLFAPTSGKDTREFIGRKTKEAKTAVNDTGVDLMERGREMYNRGRQLMDDAQELFERGRKLVRG